MKSPTLSLLESSQLVQQGAEAKVYKAWLHPTVTTSPSDHDTRVQSAYEPVLLKYRFRKHYRHPALDASLTKSRVAGEARALMKCLRAGVRVPGIRMVDAAEGVIGIEWIEGKSVRALLGGDEEAGLQTDEDTEEQESHTAAEDHLSEFGSTQAEVMSMIGSELAKMHIADVIHGDLTTSNMMLRKRSQCTPGAINTPSSELVLIDFGLSYISTLIEDKAVDLYVLERAFASTHPDSEPLFSLVLDAYAKKTGKDWKALSRRLDEVQFVYEVGREAWLVD